MKGKRGKRGVGIWGLVLLVPCLLQGQDFKADFEQAMKEEDTAKQLAVLTAWEKANPENAELLTSWFNYYFQKSGHEVVVLSTEKPSGEDYILTLTDSLNQTAGYMSSEIAYDRAVMQQGIDRIDRGIGLYPDRLDMRFGKTYVLGELKDWDAFREEILKTIRRSADNDNAWTWTENEQIEDGKAFFLSALQDYQFDLFNTGDDSLLAYMRDIAKEILRYYPDHVESLSNLSITYILTEDYDRAIEVLLRAEALAPEDYIVLMNLARAYVLKGDKDKAVAAYEKVKLYGDEDSKAFAEEKIRELSK